MRTKTREKMNRIFAVIVTGVFLFMGFSVLTVTQVKAYVHPTADGEGTLLYNFTTNAGWKNGSAGLNSTSTTLYTENGASLNMTATGSGTYWMWRNISVNFGLYGTVGIDIYCYNITTVNQLGIYFSSYTNTSWLSQASLGLRAYLDSGWNRLVINLSDFTMDHGESWANTMHKFRLQLDPLGTDATIFVDNLAKNITGYTKFIITMDGNYNATDSLAEPILDYYGFDCVRFVENSTIGTATQTTWTNLTRQYNKGWDISDHTETHANLITLSPANLTRECTYCYNALIAHGYTRSAKFFCYPFGNYNDAVIAEVDNLHVMSRDSTTGRYEKHYNDSDFSTTADRSSRLFHLKGYTITNTTSRATVMSYINRSISQHGITVFIFHTLAIAGAGAPPANYWNNTDFNLTMAYLDALETAGQCEIVTLSDYYGELTYVPAPAGPTSSPTTNYLIQTVLPILIAVSLIIVLVTQFFSGAMDIKGLIFWMVMTIIGVIVITIIV